jgi:hypothetical protein
MAKRSLGESVENPMPEEVKKVLSDLTGGITDLVENRNPDFDYIWAATGYEGPGSVRHYQSIGYEIVNSENNSDERAINAIQPNARDGALIYGDTILMRIPKHLAKIRDDYVKKLSRERMAMSQDQFEEDVERAAKASGNKSVFIIPKQTGIEIN